MLGGVASRLKKVVLPLYSVQLRSHLDCRVQCWAPHCKRNLELLEVVHCSTKKMLKVLEHVLYEEKRWDIWAVYPGQVTNKTEPVSIFSMVPRGSRQKLKHIRGLLNMRKYFFTIQITKQWNKSPRETMESPFLKIFKSQLYMILGNLL